MLLRKLLFICTIGLASVRAASAQRSEDWLPITAQDLQLKDVPGDPGACAVQLYYADFRDDMRQSEFIYRRIKVLNESGERYANIEIEVPPHYTIAGLQARTIHPDKTIVEFNGKPFDKTVMKYRGEKRVAKTFTVPAVTVGSLVEYKYSLSWSQYFDDPTWIVQHDLYTVRESFWLRRYTANMSTRHISDQTQLSFVPVNMPPGATPKDVGTGVELQVENVPAFTSEPDMPPEANLRAEVQFFYGGREIASPDIFWRDVGQSWYAQAEHFVGSHEAIKAAAAQIIGSEADPETQLRKLYARAQQTRNLSFEGEEDKPGSSGLKPNENVMDVFTRGYGTQNEIAELFAALARAAGFPVQLLRASNRRDRVFDPKLLADGQLATAIVRVTLNKSDFFLDPGTRFCPFGLVSWTSTSTPALLLDKNEGAFVVVPTATADKNVIHRTAEVTLGLDGSLQGAVTIEYRGNEALERRLNALSSDDAGRTEYLEDELESWLPPGALVQLQNVEGWDSSEEPLLAHFLIRLDNFATLAEKRLVIPASLFRSPEPAAFASTERKYPVYFPYTHEVVDRVDVRIPPDYRAETMPKGQDVKSDSTRFILTRSLQGQHLILTRALVVNAIYFQPERYQALKGFFHELLAADEEQAVLTLP
jgi:hypothetical protein